MINATLRLNSLQLVTQLLFFDSLLNISCTLGNIKMFYEAKPDSNASTCAMKARITDDSINNLGWADSNRSSRQTEEEGVDPIFNLVTVATAMEDTVVALMTVVEMVVEMVVGTVVLLASLHPTLFCLA